MLRKRNRIIVTSHAKLTAPVTRQTSPTMVIPVIGETVVTLSSLSSSDTLKSVVLG